MPLISRLRGRCYCAFCKTERSVYVKKHIDMTNVLGAMILAVAVAFVYYGEPDPRFVVLFGLFVLLGEAFVYLRWRASMVCKLCGFDPLVYKRSPERAAQGVREFYQEKSAKPEFLLSRSPLIEVHRREKRQQRRQQMVKSLATREKVAPPKSL